MTRSWRLVQYAIINLRSACESVWCGYHQEQEARFLTFRRSKRTECHQPQASSYPPRRMSERRKASTSTRTPHTAHPLTTRTIRPRALWRRRPPGSRARRQVGQRLSDRWQWKARAVPQGDQSTNPKRRLQVERGERRRRADTKGQRLGPRRSGGTLQERMHALGVNGKRGTLMVMEPFIPEERSRQHHLQIFQFRFKKKHEEKKNCLRWRSPLFWRNNPNPTTCIGFSFISKRNSR